MIMKYFICKKQVNKQLGFFDLGIGLGLFLLLAALAQLSQPPVIMTRRKLSRCRNKPLKTSIMSPSIRNVSNDFKTSKNRYQLSAFPASRIALHFIRATGWQAINQEKTRAKKSAPNRGASVNDRNRLLTAKKLLKSGAITGTTVLTNARNQGELTGMVNIFSCRPVKVDN